MRDEATGVAAAMLGLVPFVVLSAGRVGGELEVLIETVEASTGCPGCGVVAAAHGRRELLVRDVASGGQPVLLVWRKRIWRCAEPACPRRTWSETTPAIQPRAALTERARIWACQRVGRDRHTVFSGAQEHGVGWGTVMLGVKGVGPAL